MRSVSIRLLGDKESVYLLANSLIRDLKLLWKEYPVYDLDDRTKLLQGQVRLFATVSERDLDRLAGRQKPGRSSSLLDFFCDQKHDKSDLASKTPFARESD